MKKLILLLLTIGMIGLVGAIGEGDTLTQNQYDSINFETVNLQCQYHGFTIRPFDGVLAFKFSCLSANRITQGNGYVYTIYRKYWNTPIRISEALACLQQYTYQQCVNGVRNIVLDSFNSSKRDLRAYLSKWQTEDIGFNQGDFSFGEGELNG